MGSRRARLHFGAPGFSPAEIPRALRRREKDTESSFVNDQTLKKILHRITEKADIRVAFGATKPIGFGGK